MSERVRETDGEIVRATRAMYDRLGDRPGFDAHLHPDITIWETDERSGLIDLAGLQALRARRSTGEAVASSEAADAAGTAPPVVEVRDPVVDRWGDSAVIRYVLHASEAGVDMDYRVTDVLVKDDAGWRAVHHHAEYVVPQAV